LSGVEGKVYLGYMDIQKKVVTGAVLLCALFTLVFWIGTMYTKQINKVYTYQSAGFSFKYKPQFKVEEKNHREGFKIVTLLPITQIASAVQSEEPRIQCVLFQNEKSMSILSWIESEEYTHIMGRLIPGTSYPSVDIPHTEALGFKTDGLYVSDHVVFVHAGQIVDCSVDYLTLDDPLRMNFVAFIGNIKLSGEQ